MKSTPKFTSGALPLLGHALAFKNERSQLFRRGYEEHGNVFGVKLATQKAAVLIGPELHELFFKETDKSLNMEKPMRFLKAAIGNVGFVAGHEAYLNQRPVMHEPFRGKKMAQYLETMNQVVIKWLETLEDEGRLELTSSFTPLVQEVAGRAMMSDEFYEQIGDEFWDHYITIGKSLDPMLPPHLPLPKFIRRDRARKKLVKMLKPIIDQRRAKPDAYEDFLQDMINKPKKDGNPATDDEVIGLVIAILFAGHETTVGQAAWTIIQLLQNPDYLKLVLEEIKEKFPYGSMVDTKTVIQQQHLRWAIDETTRTRPSADITIRLAEKEIEVGDYVIPEGWVVFLSAEVAQFLPEIFENPYEYDPLRFSPERKEDKKHRNTIIGFGGGVHKCTGMNFAINEMLVIALHFLQRFELTLETQNPTIERGMGANRPSETWIRYRRRKAEELVSDSVIEEALEAGCPHMQKMTNSKKSV
ncbi:MAG: cytochrome P450 [Bacteroidota bacterium]